MTRTSTKSGLFGDRKSRPEPPRGAPPEGPAGAIVTSVDETSTARRGELRPMLALALPVVLAELGWMAMGVVDTMMVGRVERRGAGRGRASVGRSSWP